jgi:gamma-glutamyl hydrolase
MFQKLDSKLYRAVQKEMLVFNSHNLCISTEKITDPTGPLHKDLNLLAVNWDANGQKYIALVEHKEFPIYASQFHPEKIAFEWTPYEDIPRSHNAILFARYLGDFFVDEARRNNNRFSESAEFYKRSINNYDTVYTLVTLNSTLQSLYFFNDTRDDLR